MHANEVDTDTSLVRRLLADQFPQWADLPIKRIASPGTDNAIYRLGETMSVRMPRIHWATGQIEKEFAWLPTLAPQLPLTIPVPLAKGEPAAGYPHQWAVYRWLAGRNSAETPPTDMHQAARDIADFLHALRQIDPTPDLLNDNSRGMPLALRDADTRQAIAALGDQIDSTAALAVWQEALDAPLPRRDPVWLHGDLLLGNVLVDQGRVSAIIDFGGLAVGEPACDLMIAWSLFSAESRATFRAAMNVDDATWANARGQALSQAVIFIPYYQNTNPVGVRYAQRMLNEILGSQGVR